MSEQRNSSAKPVEEVPTPGTPTKRTPKRKADAFQKESEELLKTLGVSTEDLEDGRRRTRSSARGVTATPPTTPATPPAKRARGTTATATKVSPTSSAADSPKTTSSKSTPKKRGGQVAEPKKIELQAEEQPQADKKPAESKDTSVEKMETDAAPPAAVVNTASEVTGEAKEEAPVVKDTPKPSEESQKQEEEVSSSKETADVVVKAVADDAPETKPSSDSSLAVTEAEKEKIPVEVAAVVAKDDGSETTKSSVEAEPTLNKPAVEAVEVDAQKNTAEAPESVVEQPAAVADSVEKASDNVDNATVAGSTPTKKEESVKVDEKETPAALDAPAEVVANGEVVTAVVSEAVATEAPAEKEAKETIQPVAEAPAKNDEETVVKPKDAAPEVDAASIKSDNSLTKVEETVTSNSVECDRKEDSAAEKINSIAEPKIVSTESATAVAEAAPAAAP